LNDLSKDFFSRGEIDARLSEIHTNYSTNNEKLAQLIDVTKEQQKVIMELGSKYAQLFDDSYKQQSMLTEMAGKYENKFNTCEESLLEAREKLIQVENEVIANSEFVKVMGIRKSNNMIKKERFSPRNLAKKINKSSPKQSGIDTRLKTREKLQGARNQRKLEKEASLLFNNSEDSTKPDSSPVYKCETFTSNYLDVILNERKLSDFSSPMDTIVEIDLSSC